MIKHLFTSPEGIAVILFRLRKGVKEEIVPSENNGWLGMLEIDDKITIQVIVNDLLNHKCFTLDKNKQKNPKKVLGLGVYEKSVTITTNTNTGQTQVASWPQNMICIEVGGKVYNLGVYKQKTQFYFVIEEHTDDPDDKKYVPGEVKWFSLLRGFGAVASEDIIFDYQLHWSSIPRRSNQHPYVDSGEIVSIIKTQPIIDRSTTFFIEIKEMSI